MCLPSVRAILHIVHSLVHTVSALLGLKRWVRFHRRQAATSQGDDRISSRSDMPDPTILSACVRYVSFLGDDSVRKTVE